MRWPRTKEQSGFDEILPRWGGPHVAQQRLVVDTADLTAHWPWKSQFDNIIDASSILFSRPSRALSPACWSRVHAQQLGPVGGRDGSSSRAEMQYEFLTAEVRQKDMHVLTVASLT